jgi:methionine-rich copper-binding protein CopC
MLGTLEGVRNPVRWIVAAVLPAVLLGTIGLVMAPAAAAHDDLIGADPAPDSTVAALPAQVTLTFSGAVLAEEGISVIAVTDAAGSPLHVGGPVVSGAVVAQPLVGAASGPVTVRWRVVSADGHPISGEFGFLVAPPGPSPTATSTPSPGEAAASPTVVAEDPGATVDDSSSAGGVPLYAWLIGGAGVLVAVALVIWLLMTRSRQQHQVARERTAGRTDTHER